MRKFFVVACLSAALAAYGQDDRTTVFGRYRSATGPHLVLCAQAVEIAALKARLNKPLEPGDDPAECIRKAQDAAKRAYADLSRTLQGKPTAVEALKNTQASFMAAIQGIAPHDNEVRIAYRTRINAQRARFTEAMERLRLEL